MLKVFFAWQMDNTAFFNGSDRHLAVQQFLGSKNIPHTEDGIFSKSAKPSQFRYIVVTVPLRLNRNRTGYDKDGLTLSYYVQ